MIRHVAGRVIRTLDRVLLGRGRGLILLYHRVAADPSDPYGLCVSPENFEEHLRVLRGEGTPMTVAAMARAIREDSLPDRAVGITFDDAYADVLQAGVPLLERYETPTTIFVTVGHGGREREFWWDELEYLFLQGERLPEVLDIEIGGDARRWLLGADAGPSPVGTRAGRSWHLLDDATPTRRHMAFREIYHLLRPLPEAERTSVMDELLVWAGEVSRPVRPSRRVLEPTQVADLSNHGLVEIGAHTVTHPDLRALPGKSRKGEIRESKVELEKWTGRTIDGFAYPYGLYDEGCIDAVRDAGFAFACSGDHRAVRPRDDVSLLPRVDVPDRDGRALSRLFGRFFG